MRVKTNNSYRPTWQPSNNTSRIEQRIEGHYEKAAYDAFNATIARPMSRSSEDEVLRRMKISTSQTIERLLNDKLTSTSRAIDALYDQISNVANEIQCVNESLASRDRRIDVVCHDFDTQRLKVNNIEAQFATEIGRIRESVERDISKTEERLKQNIVDIVTKSVFGCVNEIHEQLTKKLESKVKRAESSLEQTVAKLSNDIRDERRESALQVESILDRVVRLEEIVISRQKELMTTEKVRDIVDEMIDAKESNIFNACTDEFVDIHTLKSELKSVRSEYMQQIADLSARLSSAQADGEKLSAIIEDMQQFESRVDELEDSFKHRLNDMLDVVESFEHRVQCLESGDASKEMVSELRDSLVAQKFELLHAINEARDQSNTDVCQVKRELTAVSKQLKEIELRSISSRHSVCKEDDSRNVKSGGDGVDLDDSLVQRLSGLRTALTDAKELAHTNSKQHLPEPQILSPCIHLMGLGSPFSVATADSLSLTSPRRSPDNLLAYGANNDCISTLQNYGDEPGIETSAFVHTPRSESSAAMVGSISTTEALSICQEPTSGCRDDDVIVQSPRASLLNEEDCQSCENIAQVLGTTNDEGCHLSLQEAQSETGSIISYDEIVSVDESMSAYQTNKRHALCTMDTVDIDVYEMWEMVLTELMAALSTRQNEGNSNVVNESNVSYGSSFESEG
jgi:hypothetical protein